MADSSLDDFFAKKDKSKKKGKSKFTAGDILAKQKEEPKKVPKKKKPEDKPQQTPSSTTATTVPVSNPEPEDEEWVEFQEESETDLTGLRIQNLQIREEDEEREKENAQREDGEEGQEKSDGSQGPWNKGNMPVPPPQPVAPPPEPEPEPEKSEEPVAAAPKVVGKYIPPSLRYAQAASSGSTASSGHRRWGGRREAPNIKSEEDFPTLGGAVEPDNAGDRWGSGAQFERVRSGGRQTDDPSQRRQQLELGNKFDALQGGMD